MKNDHGISLEKVARLLQVSPSVVSAWVESGRLLAFETWDGVRCVTVNELRRFTAANELPEPWEIRRREGKRTVLVVDDEQPVIRAIQRTLATHRHVIDVEGCHDGVEALVKIGAMVPDLVLLDLHMDGIDGFEVCRRLRRNPRLAQTKIVAMTAFPTDEAKQSILGCGASALLVKPLRSEQILDLLPSVDQSH